MKRMRLQVAQSSCGCAGLRSSGQRSSSGTGRLASARSSQASAALGVGVRAARGTAPPCSTLRSRAGSQVLACVMGVPTRKGCVCEMTAPASLGISTGRPCSPPCADSAGTPWLRRPSSKDMASAAPPMHCAKLKTCSLASTGSACVALARSAASMCSTAAGMSKRAIWSMVLGQAVYGRRMLMRCSSTQTSKPSASSCATMLGCTEGRVNIAPDWPKACSSKTLRARQTGWPYQWSCTSILSSTLVRA